MFKVILRFGLLIAALLILFQLSKMSLFIPEMSQDLTIGLVGAAFIGLGVYLGLKFRKVEIIEVSPSIEIDHDRIQSLGLTEREMEVLHHIAEGCSNIEIGEKLFVSENTIKTHVSNLFVKLDVKRRTQAVTRAKELRIIQ
ncbi:MULTISPECIES: response regulator transcription factor [Roseivirga]|uniref:response regulator transcription factor n=1 Tax=Roseivirga TaxID=290180 RepID=UPI001B127D70|nr:MULTISPECIES: response regulator transcription factor [Roseivirga]MBO6662507.1 response regulator transcription factor [Roseivirga sp.]MBO6909930.1 response regulator transcription factor [Roseivirga sp.]WPZ10698.1 response regulator transcription factor [Roseivirga spongicola]